MCISLGFYTSIRDVSQCTRCILYLLLLRDCGLSFFKGVSSQSEKLDPVSLKQLWPWKQTSKVNLFWRTLNMLKLIQFLLREVTETSHFSSLWLVGRLAVTHSACSWHAGYHFNKSNAYLYNLCYRGTRSLPNVTHKHDLYT